MNTDKITPIIDSTCVHNSTLDINHALEILKLDPIQAAKLLQRAINHIHSYANLARRTQIVSVPDYLFTDPDHRIFTPHYDTLNWRPIIGSEN